MELKLLVIWKFRLKLYAEGNKLRAESNKLYAEGNKLRAEGNTLWAEAIIETYGNIKLEWKNYNSERKDYECHLENGEVYGFDEKSPDKEVTEAIALLNKKGKIKDGKILV